MANKKVSVEELAEANNILKRYYENPRNVSAKEIADAHVIHFKKISEDAMDAPMFFCDTVFYSVMMQVVIIGALIPLYIHLQKDDDYFYCLRIIMGIQFAFLLGEIAYTKNRYSGRLMASVSHMLGTAAIILHLRLISPVLAMCVGIPLSLWIFATLYYQCVAPSVLRSKFDAALVI